MKPERTRQVRAVVAQIGPRDALVGGGALLCAIGSSLIYLPAGVIVLGAIALYLGLFGVPQWR